MSLYEHVSLIAPGLRVNRREALVAAARSRGEKTSVDDELRTARRRLAELDEPVPSLAAVRRRVADLEAELEAKRERVATLRGRLQASDDADDDAAEDYRTAIRELSEIETEHLAARERLEDARERAREARDERERRLRLENRIGNLERQARSELLEAARPDADAAAAAAPGSDVDTFSEAAPVTAALALVRVGTVRTPVVLACRRFPDAPTAEAWLGAPIYRL